MNFKKLRHPAFLAIYFVIAVIILLNFIVIGSLNDTIKPFQTLAEQKEKEVNELKGKVNKEREEAYLYAQVLDVKDILGHFNVLKKDVNLMDTAYLITMTSYQKGVDPYLILAIIKTESSFKNSSLSHKGAVGLMQILPSTGRYIAEMDETLDIKTAKDLYNPVINIRAGIAYLAYLVKKFGNTKRAVTAYNIGPGNMDKILSNNSPMPMEYYSTVMSNYDKITSKSTFLGDKDKDRVQ